MPVSTSPVVASGATVDAVLCTLPYRPHVIGNLLWSTVAPFVNGHDFTQILRQHLVNSSLTILHLLLPNLLGLPSLLILYLLLLLHLLFLVGFESFTDVLKRRFLLLSHCYSIFFSRLIRIKQVLLSIRMEHLILCVLMCCLVVFHRREVLLIFVSICFSQTLMHCILLLWLILHI